MKKKDSKKEGNLLPDFGDVSRLLNSEMKQLKGGEMEACSDGCKKACKESCLRGCSPGGFTQPR